MIYNRASESIKIGDHEVNPSLTLIGNIPEAS